MSQDAIFLGGSVVAAVVAGSIALFAPCCISVMLPAYMAGSVHNRRALIASTSLFGLGVATVVLPIAVGAQTLRRLLVAQHTTIYLIVGLALLGLAAFAFMGGKMQLPAPGGRPGNRTGPFGVYVLGVFSGVASSCCAPVLVGILALAGLASSFTTALGLGVAYVFGMVAPLFVISVLWQRRDWRSSRLLRPRSFTWRLGPIRRTISGTDLAAAVLLFLMGVGTVWVALTGRVMAPSSGWQATLVVWLQRAGGRVTRALSWVPEWAAWAVLLLVLALIARRAVSQLRSAATAEDHSPGGEHCHDGTEPVKQGRDTDNETKKLTKEESR